MINHNNQRKGFSLVEILVSMILLIIAIGASFTLFMTTSRLRTSSDNELEAYYNAQQWLEHVRTGFSAATRYNALIADGVPKDLNVSSILPENYDIWPMANKPKVEMLDTTYTIDNVDLGSGVNFKKITVEVKWEEPN